MNLEFFFKSLFATCIFVFYISLSVVLYKESEYILKILGYFVDFMFSLLLTAIFYQYFKMQEELKRRKKKL